MPLTPVARPAIAIDPVVCWTLKKILNEIIP
jgi:hypothetical protein